MFEQHPIIVTTQPPLVEPVRLDQVQAQCELASPSPEQVAAANGLFAQEREAQQVANLLGLWTGVQLMHHVVVDTFDTQEDDENEEKLRRASPPTLPEPHGR